MIEEKSGLGENRERSTASSRATAGRELDALIAEKVMGLVRCQGLRHDGHFPNTYCYAHPDSPTMGAEVREYSTRIEEAWEVVTSRGLGEWNWRLDQTDAGNWFAEIKLGYNSSYSKAFPVWADTAPLAICLAALSATTGGERCSCST